MILYMKIKHMNKNPCEQCIVNAMCKKQCDLLTDYLIKNLPDPLYNNWQYDTIGKALRERVWKLRYIEGKLMGVEHYESMPPVYSKYDV